MTNAHVARVAAAVAPTVALVAAVLWLWRDTAIEMVRIWIRSDTFTHAFLVPPIVVWLVWRQRAVLRMLPRRPVPSWLVVIAGVCLLWVLGELAVVATASQFALIALLVLTVPALHGWSVTRSLAFPLAFLFFAVPFGEFAVPALMEWTADFTVLALRASGIPVYREGLQFVIPSGHWSVVQACSGVRYLIASFMVGTLFAYLNYQSTSRRVLFMGVALVVPLIANWLRAYMIVMIGHLSDNKLAAGVDHLIYGWVFFGIVIGLMFLVGARWAEPEVDPRTMVAGDDRAGLPPGAAPIRVWIVVAAVLLLQGGSVLMLLRLTHPDARPQPSIAWPMAPAGWQSLSLSAPWTPGYLNPSTAGWQAMTDGQRTVWTWIGYYRDQSDTRKLVSSANDVAVEGGPWIVAARELRPAREGLPGFRASILRPDGNLAAQSAGPRWRVWQAYWVSGRWVSGDAEAKLRMAVDRLLGLGDDSAVVMLATPEFDTADDELEKFARARIETIRSALAATRDTSGLN